MGGADGHVTEPSPKLSEERSGVTDQFANGDPTHDAQKSEDSKRGTVTGALALGANPPVRMGPVLVLDKLRDLDLDAPHHHGALGERLTVFVDPV